MKIISRKLNFPLLKVNCYYVSDNTLGLRTSLDEHSNNSWEAFQKCQSKRLSSVKDKDKCHLAYDYMCQGNLNISIKKEFIYFFES